MKKVYLLNWLWLMSWFGYAQTNANISPLSPQSPNAASLGRFGEHPVGLFTGVPSINVPIHEISAGSIRVPVSLDYHAGGHRVTDVASWVGLGWALNAGGAITRTVIGRPDERDGVLSRPLNLDLRDYISYGQGFINFSNTTIEQNCENYQYELDEYARNQFDTGYDIFSFTLPGRSGKFILIPDGNGSQVTTMPFERFKITYTRNMGSVITEFKVVDEDGVIYVFDQLEMGSSSQGFGTYVTTWYLSRIEGNRPNDVVRFYYESLPSYAGVTDFLDQISLVDQVNGVCNSNPGVITQSRIQTTTTLSTLALREIVFPGGKINCVSGAIRTDIAGNNPELDYIDLYGININNSYQLIKRFDLIHSYFVKNSSDNPNFFYLNGPLNLTAVSLQDSERRTIAQYRFDYNTDTPLPGPYSRNRDAWGYFNGKFNTTLIPIQTISIYNVANLSAQVIIGGADRSCSEAHMQAWILNRITYPTGGFSQFFYEANRYEENGVKLAGGLRVKRIETQAAVGEPIKVKTYKYGVDENGNGILNVNLSIGFWRLKFRQKIAPACDQSTTVFSSNTSAGLSPFDSSPVVYDEVVEYEGTYDGATLIENHNGKTINTFRIRSDVMYGIGNNSEALNRNYVASYHWDRGQLLSKATFSKSGALIQKQINTYTNPVRTNVVNIGVLLSAPNRITPDWQNAEGYYRLVRQCERLGYEYSIPPNYYPWPKGNIRLVRTENLSYGTDGGSTSIATETNYNTDFQPNEQINYASDGSSTIRRIRYPFDFSLPGSPSGSARGLQVLRERNERNTVIEEYSFKKSEPSDSNPFLTNGKLTLYGESLGITGYAIPKEVYSLEVLNRCCRLGDYSPVSVASGTVQKSGQYALELTYNSYDGRSNPLEFTLRNGLKTQLNWLSRTTNPNGNESVLAVLQSETSNAGTSNSLTTEYGYELPILGLKTIKAPNDQITRYDYDSFGRLKAIKDQDYNLIKTFDYNYVTGDANPKNLVGASITPPTIPSSPTTPPPPPPPPPPGGSCTPRNPDAPGTTTPGLSYRYFEVLGTSEPCNAEVEINGRTPQSTGTVTTNLFDLSQRTRSDNYVFEYTGYLDVPIEGEYTFYLSSDDDSRLFIGNELIVSHGGCHGLAAPGQEPSGKKCLKAGRHAIKILFLQKTGGFGLNVLWSGPGFTDRQSIPTARWSSSGTTPGGCTPTTSYLSDLAYQAVSNGWGPVEKDRANGEQGAGDGPGLRIRNQSYAKGLGTHANSEVTLHLGGTWSRFQAVLGIDDYVSTSSPASVVFKVIADGVTLYTSPTLRRSDAAVSINVDVTGRTQLRLVVEDAGNGGNSDHADWADAKLVRECGSQSDTQAPSAPGSLSSSNVASTSLTLSWSASTDNVGVTGYDIYQNGSLIGQTASTSFNVTGLTASTTYTFTVRAKDAAGNVSGASNSVNVTTPSSGGGCTPTTTYVSDLNWAGTPINAWGPVEKDRSNGENAGGDGVTLTLNGVTYAKGLGVHAASEVVYNLGGTYTRFKSAIGIDDEVSSAAASVVFEVWADGQRIFQSGVLRHDSPTGQVDVDVTGKQELKLIVTQAGDGPDSDHADWAGARLERACGTTGGSGGNGTGASGQYFNNKTLEGTAVLTRTDAVIDFNWGNNSPGAGVNADNFSAKWKGKIEAPVSGTYRFATWSDDGVRLWINGAQVINNWTDHGPTRDESAAVGITLTAGQQVPFEMEFYDSGYGAEARLEWTYPGQTTWQAIPQSRLYPDATGCTPPGAPTITGGGNVCNGQTVTLTASGCSGTVRWSNGATGSTITVGAGTYTARCEVGCQSNPSNAITVTANNCGGGSCPTFTEGQEIGRRGSAASERAIVHFVGGCPQVWWADMSGRTNRDWLIHLTNKPHSDEILGSCLKWDGDTCP